MANSVDSRFCVPRAKHSCSVFVAYETRSEDGSKHHLALQNRSRTDNSVVPLLANLSSADRHFACMCISIFSSLFAAEWWGIPALEDDKGHACAAPSRRPRCCTYTAFRGRLLPLCAARTAILHHQHACWLCNTVRVRRSSAPASGTLGAEEHPTTSVHRLVGPASTGSLRDQEGILNLISAWWHRCPQVVRFQSFRR